MTGSRSNRLLTFMEARQELPEGSLRRKQRRGEIAALEVPPGVQDVARVDVLRLAFVAARVELAARYLGRARAIAVVRPDVDDATLEDLEDDYRAWRGEAASLRKDYRADWATEVQAGSYTLMDTAYAALPDLPFERALSLWCTVIHVSDGWAVADGGLKALGMDHGNPSIDGADVLFCSDEHTTFVPDPSDRVAVGDVGEAAYSPIPPALWEHADEVTPIPFDPGRARQLLEEAANRPGVESPVALRPRRPHRLSGPDLRRGGTVPRPLPRRRLHRPARLLEPQAAERLQRGVRALHRRQALGPAARGARRLPEPRGQGLRPAGRRGARPARRAAGGRRRGQRRLAPALGLVHLRAGVLDHLLDELAFVDRQRERLLAIDVLAGGDGGESHLLRQRIKRSDVEDVDLWFGDEVAQVGFAFAQTNTGHDSTEEPGGSFVLSDPQKAIDYAYRAVHVTASNR